MAKDMKPSAKDMARMMGEQPGKLTVKPHEGMMSGSDMIKAMSGGGMAGGKPAGLPRTEMLKDTGIEVSRSGSPSALQPVTRQTLGRTLETDLTKTESPGKGAQHLRTPLGFNKPNKAKKRGGVSTSSAPSCNQPSKNRFLKPRPICLYSFSLMGL